MPYSSQSPDVRDAQSRQDVHFDFTPDLLASFPFTEVSAALRSRIGAIVKAWIEEISVVLPAATRLPFDSLPDSVPDILSALADALGSTDPAVRRVLLARSPSQGITRFQQHYSARDVMTEDRMMRRHVVRHVEDALSRRMTSDEQLALSMGIDLMSQQANVAFMEHQEAQLRAGAEAELRYLSFLSHDLNNNLSAATLWLQVLKTQLQAKEGLGEQVDVVDTVQTSILTTIGGMGRLLQAERLRHGGAQPEPKPVDLRSLVANQTRQVADQARRRGIKVIVEVPEDTTVTTDPQLITLVLQNLLGNAAKFAGPGVVRVRAEQRDAAGGGRQWALAVIDQGPGIPKDSLDRIFVAFQRGTMQGEAGVGLGLAIASRAASLLGGTLTVESVVGVGSTFTLLLPAVGT